MRKNKKITLTLSSVVESIILYETKAIMQNLLKNHTQPYMNCENDLRIEYNVSVKRSVQSFYEKMSRYPVRDLTEIVYIQDQIERFCKKIYIDAIYEVLHLFSGYSSKESIEKRMYSDSSYQDIHAEILIWNEILKDNLYTEKHKNLPIILSGIWGVVGSLLGAVIGAVATLIASGIISWPL